MNHSGHDIKLSLLMTGDELIRAAIPDTNADCLTKGLSDIGLPVLQKITVGDSVESIAAALRYLSSNSDIVIVNGGLGTTSDDRTLEAVAAVSGERFARNEDAVRQVGKNFRRVGRNIEHLPDGVLDRFTVLPKSAGIIGNDRGIALGLRIKILKAVCYFTPGVPAELTAMFRDRILHDIQKSFNPAKGALQFTVHYIGVGETEVEREVLLRLTEEESKAVRIGLRIHSPYVDLTLGFPNGASPARRDAIGSKIDQVLPQCVLPDGKGVAHEIVRLLRGKKRRLALAESCTGGRTAALLTGVSGASAVFETGLVTYSNRSKTDLLSVPQRVIETEGAVSGSVAKRMVEGLLKTTKADCGLAITGIAGPTGGRDGKPVGTVYIAWGDRERVSGRRLLIRRPRTEFQDLVATVSLDLMRRYLMNYGVSHTYFFDTLSRIG